MSEQMWVAPPIVSEDARFLTRLLSFIIYALEKLNEIVTARGRPSGIATTTTVIAIIIVFNTSVHNLFSIEKLKLRGTHFGSSSQFIMF